MNMIFLYSPLALGYVGHALLDRVRRRNHQLTLNKVNTAEYILANGREHRHNLHKCVIMIGKAVHGYHNGTGNKES